MEREQPGGATGSWTTTPSKVRVKKECSGESTDGHLHTFSVKFGTANKKYQISCDQPRTVLAVLESTEKYKKLQYSHESITIQLGKADKEYIVAAHFPCSCISEGECLIISGQKGKGGRYQDQHDLTVRPRDSYSVFYIDTEGGLHTKTKKLFRNNAVKQFKFLCVYGEKGMTVEEALKLDGRFINDLGDFFLSDNDDPNCITERTQRVDHLDEKRFKIRLPRNTSTKDEKQKEKTGASKTAQQTRNTKSVLDAVEQKGISVKTAVQERSRDGNTEEVYEILRQQFPELKKQMESRFPNDSYQEELSLRKEDFGKIQQSFSEVHRLKKLLKLGESVCKIVIQNVGQGTGFVLFDNFILTNRHLFEHCLEGERLRQGIEVFVLFNYEDPDPHKNYSTFQLADSIICHGGDELDYAILELNPQGQKPNQTTQTEEIKIPPGLLKLFAPTPPNGEACIIGHPAGEVKKIDPTCIIEKERREQAVNDHSPRCHTLIVHVISEQLKAQGIEKMMMGGEKAERVTYNTFMYHGSSGSPVFDAHGQVFGLHTGGYVYEFRNLKDSVIEFAQPLLTIFEHFVSKLRESGQTTLLERAEKEAKKNDCLKKILNLKAASTDKPADADEHSDSDEPMETDEA